jgi:cytochrome c-type biogenesis protein CcmH
VSSFVLAAAALVALSLAFVLPALWSGARRTALAMVLVMPLGAAGLYYAMGTPAALDPANRTMPASIEEAIAQLQRRLADEPDNLEGWVLLGRTLKNQGRDSAMAGNIDAALKQFAAARDAFLRAKALSPEEPDLLVETAEALSLAEADRRFGAEATTLLDQALGKVPNHQRGLWFRGIAALQTGDAAGAVQRWEALLPQVDPATAEALREQIAGAREAAGMPAMSDVAVAPSAPNPAVQGNTLALTLNADPAAVAAMPEQAVLFIFARNADAAAGPPVAAQRIVRPQFPLQVQLSDADSLMPSAKLSATPRISVSARYARSGSVQPEAGDLVAEPVVVELANAAAPIALTLAPSETPTEAARAPTFGP